MSSKVGWGDAVLLREEYKDFTKTAPILSKFHIHVFTLHLNVG